MDAMHIPTDHEQVHIRPGRRTGLPVMIAIHSTALGPAIGGLRIKSYERSVDGLTDCLRLAEAMTYKAAAIDNGTGGGKAVVPLAPGLQLTPAMREALLLDVAEQIHALDGAYYAGPDVGTGPEDMDFMFRRTPWVGGRSKAAGGAGGTTFGTFVGLESAVKAAVEVVLAETSVAGLRFSIVGLGGIGSLLARLLRQEGAQLILSDIDPSKQALAGELGARWLAPDAAMVAECDVLVPCALGGVLSDDNIHRLQCRIICGAANNQLRHDGLAALLLARGIVYVPDFIANAGGLMYAVAIELHRRTEADASAHTRNGIARNVRTVLAESMAGTVTSLQAALQLGQRRLAGASLQVQRQASAECA